MGFPAVAHTCPCHCGQSDSSSLLASIRFLTEQQMLGIKTNPQMTSALMQRHTWLRTHTRIV